MLADWQELRKNANKPGVIGKFDDPNEPLNVENLIKTFQDTVDVNLVR